MLIKQTPLHLLAQAPRHSLFHRHCDLLAGDGQLIKAFVGGVVDGIGHGGQRGVDDDLTDGLCAKRAGALVAALKTSVNMSNISAACRAKAP